MDFHGFWYQNLTSFSEMSGHKYCYYIMNCTTGEYIGNSPNQTKYILMFTTKNNELSNYWAFYMQNHSEALNEAGFKLAYIDNTMDPHLKMAFDTKPNPHFFVVEDGFAYSFEYKIPMIEYNTTVDWFLNGTYKDSLYKMPLPVPLTANQMYLYNFLEGSLALYHHLLR